MRTRTLITSAAFLAVSAAAGTASAQLQMKGSDTLDLVTKEVITNCPGVTTAGGIVYIGGGSGTGQAAMVASPPTQHVAPMSRQMNNAASCTTNSRQLLIGLDGIAVVAVNSTGGDPNTCTDDIGGNSSPLVLTGIPSQFINCTSDTQCATAGNPNTGSCNLTGGYCNVGGTILGCTAAQGCSPDGTYTFDLGNGAGTDDWKDVLAQIYGGQNHTSAGQTTDDTTLPPTEVNADGTAICTGARKCKRNPARIDCANPVRGVLMANYGSVIRSPLCTGTGCTKLRHAFRRDDLSGTTDAFQAIVGLVAIAPFTTLRSTATPNLPEIADTAAVANPFCNAGTAALNKGFSDGLDLDPYRRACTRGPSPDLLGFETVCEGNAGANNSDATCYVAQGTPAISSPTNYPQRDRSAPQGRGTMAGGTADTFALLQADLTGNLTKPRCLGVVLPISVPQDVEGATVWATNRYAGGGNCTAGVRGFVNPYPVHQMICPDGSLKAASGTCRLAQNTSNGRFDCVVDSTLAPGNTPDPRVYNLMPVDNLGHIATLIDSYSNPSISTTPSLRRFARRFYALHSVRPDNSQKAATVTNCTQTDDTSLIGCLVKASPCSIGYAGREAADPSPGPWANVALRIESVQATQATIENLATGGGTVYPLARKLWFNSANNPGDLVGFTQPNLTDAEAALAVCMGLPNACTSDGDCTSPGVCNTGTGRCTTSNTATVDMAISDHNFVVVPSTVQRLVLSGGNTGVGCPL